MIMWINLIQIICITILKCHIITNKITYIINNKEEQRK